MVTVSITRLGGFSSGTFRIGEKCNSLRSSEGGEEITVASEVFLFSTIQCLPQAITSILISASISFVHIQYILVNLLTFLCKISKDKLVAAIDFAWYND